MITSQLQYHGAALRHCLTSTEATNLAFSFMHTLIFIDFNTVTRKILRDAQPTATDHQTKKFLEMINNAMMASLGDLKKKAP